ncbi:hypothetical protein [Paenibacillus sp. tmac-D7]|uniref:hypothetical protein n=1 Tax=Paenibacillus sp. tmac-D7 TaxID=2591462 RepID=UPI0011416D86|nr:hypothetical protein [Paenibacillus sp. tmac-D7]
MARPKKTHPIDDLELDTLERELREPLAGYVARAPRMEDTARLLAKLQPEFELLRKKQDASQWENPAVWHKPTFWRQCLLQVQTFGKAFWIISLIAFVLLTLSSSLWNRTPGLDSNLYGKTLPLFFFASLLYGYRTWNPKMRMVESVTPFPPALLMLIRLLLMIGMTTLLGLIGSVYLVLSTDAPLSLLSFMLRWLSELLLIGGLLAYVAFRRGIKHGFAAGVGAWTMLLAGEQWLRFNEFVPTTLTSILELLGLAAGCLLLMYSYRISAKLYRYEI